MSIWCKKKYQCKILTFNDIKNDYIVFKKAKNKSYSAILEQSKNILELQ